MTEDIARKTLEQVANNLEAPESARVAAATRLLELDAQLGRHSRPVEDSVDDTALSNMTISQLERLAEQAVEDKPAPLPW